MNWQMRAFRITKIYGVVYPDRDCGRVRVVGEDGIGV